MSEKIKAKRREEIVNACEELYQTKTFKEITLKDISHKTSFSRPSIYNYYKTKEEIFIALIKREYERWNEDLEGINGNVSLSEEEFSKLIAKSLEKREQLLKLLSTNLYEIEENSRLERIVEYKIPFNRSMELFKKALDKFFNEMSEEEKINATNTFFSFIQGIYPYTMATQKQKEAMFEAKTKYVYTDLYEFTYKGILTILG